MSKSYVTIEVCPWCNKDTGNLLLDRRLRDSFEKHTPSNRPCESCMKEAILLYDHLTHEFIGYAKKSAFLNPESLDKFKGAPVKALIRQDGDKIQFVNPPKEKKEKKEKKNL